MQWQRPPTPDELQGLIEAYIREEILCREALALGLDRDDTIIRRRLAQKFEFVTEDLAAPPEPTREELAQFLEQHLDRYEIPARVSFVHVYFSPDRRSGSAEEDARRALESLRAGADAAAHGDPFLLDLEFHDKSVAELEHQFGEDLARAIMTVELNAWQGPVLSAFGWHVVKLAERRAARLPQLTEVEERVRRDWEAAHRVRANEEMFARLRARYEVVVESPAHANSNAASAADRSVP